MTRLSQSDILRPSVIILILANMAPIYGVLFLGWQVFPVVLLFWMENIVIGVLNVARMILASPRNRFFWLLKFFLIPFFCFHYGLFTLVHGVFVVGFFGGMFRQGAPFPNAMIFLNFIRENQLEWPLAGLALSHMASFLLNYVGEGEYLKASPLDLMQQPYGRVVILHLTILCGGFLVMAFQSPLIGLLLLVLLKIGFDMRAHVREHGRRVGPVASPSTPIQEAQPIA